MCVARLKGRSPYGRTVTPEAPRNALLRPSAWFQERTIMRLSHRRILAALATAFAGSLLAGCPTNGTPIAPNGPDAQSFSTNNALVRFVQGSPDLNATGTGLVDLEIDGTIVATNLPFGAIVPTNPTTGLSNYYSVPSGATLVELLAVPAAGSGLPPTLIGLPFEFTTKTGDRWSVTAGGNHIGGLGVETFNLFATNDGHYLTPANGFAFTFHNASPNQGTTTATFSCTGCNGAGTEYRVGLGQDVEPQIDASNDSLNLSAAGSASNSPVTEDLTRNNFLPSTFSLNYVNVDEYQVDSNTTGDSEILFTVSQNG